MFGLQARTLGGGTEVPAVPFCDPARGTPVTGLLRSSRPAVRHRVDVTFACARRKLI